MRWVVTGADPVTGRETSFEVDAADEAEARGAARRRKMYVCAVAPVAPIADYASLRPSGAPGYSGLTIASVALGVCSWLYYAAALFGAGFAVMKSSEKTGEALYIFLASLGSGGVGALFHGASAACVALRDMARNSFSR
jgi:hypothetical protein